MTVSSAPITLPVSLGTVDRYDVMTARIYYHSLSRSAQSFSVRLDVGPSSSDAAGGGAGRSPQFCIAGRTSGVVGSRLIGEAGSGFTSTTSYSLSMSVLVGFSEANAMTDEPFHLGALVPVVSPLRGGASS